MKHETIPAVVQDLMNARQLIVEKWAKGCGLSAPAEGYCALTALRDGGNPQDLMQLLRGSLTVGQPSIHGYNDHPTTTKQDILDLYDRAISRALAAHK